MAAGDAPPVEKLAAEASMSGLGPRIAVYASLRDRVKTGVDLAVWREQVRPDWNRWCRVETQMPSTQVYSTSALS